MKFIEDTETGRVVYNEGKYKLMQINCSEGCKYNYPWAAQQNIILYMKGS